MKFLYVTVLVPALADWVAVARGHRRLERVAKPATVAVLMVVTAVAWEGERGGPFIATMLALTFSLAGDVFLMQDRDLLLPGLVAFFAAHLSYIAAFGGAVLSPYSVFIGTTLVLISGPLFLAVRQGLQRSNRTRLIVPVLAYVVVISVMVLTALTSPGANDWSRGSILAAALGAGLFYTSDALIGLHRFVRELPWARGAIMVTYHLGQIGLVYSLAYR
ncbi:MAG: lysoplasmalogenase [Actinomycetota bacterium]|nr:lysoplasmalogenase [Actinomycetota bacterium]